MRVHNPKAFVDSLQLNHSEQQDANEWVPHLLFAGWWVYVSKLIAAHHHHNDRFHQLFMDVLENVSHASSDDMISKLFHGVWANTTQCTSCRKKSTRPEAFSQVQLNIKVMMVVALWLGWLFGWSGSLIGVAL